MSNLQQNRIENALYAGKMFRGAALEKSPPGLGWRKPVRMPVGFGRQGGFFYFQQKGENNQFFRTTQRFLPVQIFPDGTRIHLPHDACFFEGLESGYLSR